jgi:outer membrane protein insertion porin family
LILTAVVVALCLGQAGDEAPVVLGVELRLPNSTDPALVKEVPGMVTLRRGQRLTIRAVQRTIERLMDTGGFSDVVVTAEDREGGVEIVISASPRLKVGEVFCEGSKALRSSEVVAASKLLPGSEVSADSLADAVENVRLAYRRKGYLHASVNAATSSGESGVDVVLQVSEGWPTRLSGVVFSGDTGLPEPQLVAKLEIAVGDIVDQEKVEKAAERLRELLRLQRFYRAHLDAPVLDDNGRLTVPIKAGPQYATRYRGNRRYPDAVLDGVYAYDGSETLDRTVLDRMGQKLTAFYRYRGFHDVVVDVRESVGPSGHKGLIVVEVDEGRPLLVRHLKFQGNQAISTNELEGVLRAVMQTEAPVPGRLTDAYTDPLKLQGRARDPVVYDTPNPSPETVLVESAYRDAMQAMRTLYRDRGYLEAHIELEPIELLGSGGVTDVTFNITEGKQVTFSAVKYEGGPEAFPPAGETQWGLGGKPFSARTVERVRQALSTELARRGYAYAKVEGGWTLDGQGHADVLFTMATGPQVHVGKIFVRGLYRTDEAVVRGQLVIAEGKTLSPDELIDSQRNLITLGIFKTVDVRLLSAETAEPVKDVLIELAEGKRLSGEWSLGYFLAEGPRAVVDLGFPNLFGEGVALQGHFSLNYFGASALAATRAIDVSTLNQATLFGGTANVSVVKRGLFAPELTGRVDLIAERVFRPSFQFTRVAVDVPGLDWSKRFRTGLDRIPRVKLSLQFQNEVELSYEVPESASAELLASLTVVNVIDLQRQRFPYGTFALWTPRAGFTIDLRDDPVLPRFGGVLTGSIAPTFNIYAVDQNNTPQRVEFLKVQGQASAYLPFGPMVLALLARGGYIFQLADPATTVTPFSSRFYVGGAQSLRGFSEDGLLSEDQRASLHNDVNNCRALANGAGCTANSRTLAGGGFVPSTGGESFGVGKAELRFPFVNDVNLGVFFEMGNLWVNQPATIMLRPVAGTGLRYLSPIGPLALDVGFNLLPDVVVNEPAFQVHFNVGVF